MKPLYVYGPPGCGKTTNAQLIADIFGCTAILDNWTPGDKRPITSKTLILTNVNVPYAVSYEKIIKELQPKHYA